jgi:hypothetical protein
MKREAELADRQGRRDLDSWSAVPVEQDGTVAQVGASRGQAGDGSGGELGECGFTIGEAVVEDGCVGAGLDDLAAREHAHQANADDLQEVGDLVGGQAREGDELGLAVRAGLVDAVKDQGVPVRIQTQIAGNALHDGDRTGAAIFGAVGAHAAGCARPALNRRTRGGLQEGHREDREAIRRGDGVRWWRVLRAMLRAAVEQIGLPRDPTRRIIVPELTVETH